MTSKVLRYILAILFVGLIYPHAMASHLRSIEIQVRQGDCSNMTVEIIVTAYVNYLRTNTLFGGEDDILDFGDGSSVLIPETPHEIVDASLYIGRAQYKIFHTYSTFGTYKITYSEPNRNAGILNFTGSVETRFYTETSFLLKEGQCNNSPVLLVPPVDKACRGIAFSHNAGATDPDGDSLSYELVIPKSALNTHVKDYLFPNQEPFYSSSGINYQKGNENQDGPPSFHINQSTGTLIWDAPGSPGEYGFALKITAWRYDSQARTWYQNGYMVRDMQVIVEECTNKKPELTVPEDVCVIAGATLTLDFPAFDPDHHDVVVDAFSEIFDGVKQVTTSPSVGVQQSTSPPATASFRIIWKTTCEDVRTQPYRIILKISDRPPSGPRLVRFYSLEINVIAPRPEYEFVTVNPVTKRVTLSWKDYSCENVSAFQVWRRISESAYDQSECETGLPAFLSYTLMAELPPTAVDYIDSDLSHGAQYCYRILPLVGGNRISGQASMDTCLIPKPAEAPVITNVSIETTDTSKGSALVRWTRPFEIDSNQYPEPYLYRVLRKNLAIPDSEFTNVTPGRLSDTVYLDTELNTSESIYRYKIELYVPALTTEPVDTSSEASSAFVTASGKVNAISLSWEANTPWSNHSQRYPYHFIYRSTSPEGRFDLIDSVNVHLFDFTYTDSGQYNNTPLTNGSYYYKIETLGSYGNPKIKDPLRNFSEITPGQLLDTIPPCVARPAIDPTDCSEFACDGSDYFTKLQWDTDCSDEVSAHEIYVNDGDDDTFTLLATVTENVYVHRNVRSLNKCYRIISRDAAGNRSDSSAVVCNSNCVNFKLPNVITPGIKDEKNDYLTSYPPTEINKAHCARGVQKVALKVFSRLGR